MNVNDSSKASDSVALQTQWKRRFGEEVKASGRVHIVVYDKFGNVKEERDTSNLIVTAGKNHIAARQKTAGIPAEMSHMAVGTGATAPAVGDTTLETELSRVALNTAGGTAVDNVVMYSATFDAGAATGALTEAGILNAGAAGALLCRTTFAVVNKGAEDAMTIIWTVTHN